MGNNFKIFTGDVFEGLEKIGDETVDLFFIDPPYNIGKKYSGNGKDKWDSDEKYLEWCYKWIDICVKKLKPTGSMYLMAATQFMPYLDIYLRKKMNILSRIIWYYDSSGVQAKKFYGSLHEPILFAVKNEKNYIFNASDILIEAKTGSQRKLIDYRKNPPEPYNTMKVPGNVWYYPRVRFRMPEYIEHPSQKPEALLERIIKASSNEGDFVVDPFSGTFTTGAVALKLKRKFYGIEISEEYVAAGEKRLNKILGD